MEREAHTQPEKSNPPGENPPASIEAQLLELRNENRQLRNLVEKFLGDTTQEPNSPTENHVGKHGSRTAKNVPKLANPPQQIPNSKLNNGYKPSLWPGSIEAQLFTEALLDWYNTEPDPDMEKIRYWLGIHGVPNPKTQYKYLRIIRQHMAYKPGQ